MTEEVESEKEAPKENQRIVGEEAYKTVKSLKCDNCGFTESLYAFEVEERICNSCGGNMKPIGQE